jgi:hypothetical protein
MKLNLGSVLTMLGISLFTGFIIITIGLGAAVPVINRVAAPFACSRGKMQLETETSSYTPGQSTTTLNWLCVDESSGAQEPINFKVIMYAGLIYGLGLFVILIGATLGGVNWGGTSKTEPFVRQGQPDGPLFVARHPNALSTQQKLRELKELRSQDLISEQEYEMKRAEILKEF